MKEHTCSYYCKHPECIRAQRDYLRDRLEKVDQGGAVAGEPDIRWTVGGGMYGHPTDHDVREYLQKNKLAIGCHCEKCKQFYTRPADPALAGRLIEEAEWLDNEASDNKALCETAELLRDAAAALGGGK